MEYKSVIINVVDGDTIDMIIELTPNLLAIERIRLLGIDAPETRGEEKPEGLAAEQFVKERILHKEVGLITDWRKDSFGRVLGNVITDGEDLSEVLLREGFAKVYKKANLVQSEVQPELWNQLLRSLGA